jgi:hypothetical protein
VATENGRGKPPITAEAQENFLELIREGEVRHLAAPQVGETASRFRGLIRRNAEFRQRYLDALVESGRDPAEEAALIEIKAAEKEHLLDRLFDAYVERALDPKAGASGSSNRALQNLLTLTHDVFKPFLEARMHRHIHSGSVGVFAMPQIDTGKWTIEEHEEFVKINARRDELLAKARPADAVEPPRYELPPADDDTIDHVGEVVEVP